MKMKKLNLKFLVLLLAVACSPQKQETADTTTEVAEEPAAEVKLTGNFGGEISGENAVTTTQLLAELEESDSVAIKVKSEILKTCAMKGCWMNLALTDEEQMRVTFKDYGFFVPKEGVEGKTAIIEGYAQKVTTDVETLRHFAKDEGKSQQEIDAITEPKNEITFVASGVIIQD